MILSRGCSSDAVVGCRVGLSLTSSFDGAAVASRGLVEVVEPRGVGLRPGGRPARALFVGGGVAVSWLAGSRCHVTRREVARGFLARDAREASCAGRGRSCGAWVEVESGPWVVGAAQGSVG